MMMMATKYLEFFSWDLLVVLRSLFIFIYFSIWSVGNECLLLAPEGVVLMVVLLYIIIT